MKEWRAEQAVLDAEIAAAERAGEEPRGPSSSRGSSDVRADRHKRAGVAVARVDDGRAADGRLLGLPRAPPPAAPLGPPALEGDDLLRQLQADPLLGFREGQRAALVLYFDGASRGNPGPVVLRGLVARGPRRIRRRLGRRRTTSRSGGAFSRLSTSRSRRAPGTSRSAPTASSSSGSSSASTA